MISKNERGLCPIDDYPGAIPAEVPDTGFREYTPAYSRR